MEQPSSTPASTDEEKLKKDHEALKEEVRSQLSDEERTKFDEVMVTKTQLVTYLTLNIGDLKDEFVNVKYKCDANLAKSLQQIRSGSAPVCRFCPAWDSYQVECRIRKHLARMQGHRK